MDGDLLIFIDQKTSMISASQFNSDISLFISFHNLFLYAWYTFAYINVLSDVKFNLKQTPSL